MITRSTNILAAMLALCLPAEPARADNATSFVATGGSNGNPCTRAAPCGDLGTAVSKTQSGGSILCLDSGPFFGGLIDRSITVDCPGARIKNTAPGINVNGAGIAVTIRGMAIAGDAGFAQVAVLGSNMAALSLENCVIENVTDSSGIGVKFAPSAPGSQLFMTDCRIDNNGVAPSTGGGIVINPAAGGSAVVALNRVTVANNVFGIAADGSSSTAGIAMVIRDSMIHRNKQDGIVATTPSGGAPIGLTIENTASVSNNIGIRATGPNVTVRVDRATVIHNGTGLVVNNGASLLSAGNNMVTANGTNGAFSGSVGLQ